MSCLKWAKNHDSFLSFLLGKKMEKCLFESPNHSVSVVKNKHMEITIKTTYFLPPLQNSFQLGP